ncbi:hypothetical protein O6H91_23G070300 [Diphasiastrum complanatum]|uniref:Uncharacterized protein n=1 Tax=Diphasiastrum complanatum TaxID=34168 RepID=A0ACC2ABW3_DIPCM|nr:hypothetical protein O6H91_23G070300 [Diphasiastrum complanatum]
MPKNSFSYLFFVIPNPRCGTLTQDVFFFSSNVVMCTGAAFPSFKLFSYHLSSFCTVVAMSILAKYYVLVCLQLKEKTYLPLLIDNCPVIEKELHVEAQRAEVTRVQIAGTTVEMEISGRGYRRCSLLGDCYRCNYGNNTYY